MQGFKCIWHFPKKYCAHTVFDESGFPLYMRRRQLHTIKKGNAELDNQWVVPYNRDLLVKYQCHMNIEICCHARSIKYLFKYCLKGHDTATVQVTDRRRNRTIYADDEPIDEIKQYFDGRYVCGSKAAYQIFGFPIHHRIVSVERLPFHLPGQKNCTFRANESLTRVAEREKYRLSKLEAFFQLNQVDVNARQYTYDEIPRYYVWNDTARKWTTRKRGNQIGRISYTHHTAGELWYLRLLLTKVRGPTSFQFLRTVNSTCYNTFRDACKEYGLLDDDKEWHEVIEQCAVGGLPPQIRQLFVHIVVNCKVTDLSNLWDSHWKQMIDDILLKRRDLSHDPQLVLNDKQIMFYALGEYIQAYVILHANLRYIDEVQPWISFICTECKQMVLQVNDSYKCLKCNRRIPHPEKRFNLNVVASDLTGPLEILLQNREVRILTGKTVEDVFSEHQNSKTYPKLLKNLARQNVTMKLWINEANVTKGDKVYLATNICTCFWIPDEIQQSEPETMQQSTLQASTSTYHLEGISELNFH